MKGLILTYIVTYATAVVSLPYPLIGFYVFVAFGILRPQEIFRFAGDLSSISSIVGYPLIAGWALAGFGTWKMKGARPAMIFFFLFVLWFLLSSVTALNTLRSYASVVTFSKLVIPVIAGATLMKTERDWRILAWTIVLSQGYVGFEQNLNYAYKGFNTAAEGFGGMDNNFFGLSLVTTLGPAIALTLASRTWAARMLAAASTALILHTILLTFSRGAMVGMLAVGVVAFTFMPKRPKNVAALLVVALLAARFTGPQLLERYSTAFVSEEQRDGSAESRVELWRDCLIVIQQYPILGVGPGNWRTIASQFGWPEGKSAHSVWMETAAEVGIPGVIALFMFFAMTSLRLVPLARTHQTDDNQFEVYSAQGVVLAATGFIVSGQFVSAPALEVPYYVMLVGIGLLKTHQAAPREAEQAKPVARWQAALAGGESTPLPVASSLATRR